MSQGPGLTSGAVAGEERMVSVVMCAKAELGLSGVPGTKSGAEGPNQSQGGEVTKGLRAYWVLPRTPEGTGASFRRLV